jgi:hypothetical protein
VTGAQRGVLAGMAGGLAVALALTFWCTSGSPGLALSPHAFSLSQRLMLAAAAWTGPLICLAAAIGAVANRRFFSAQDIDGAGLTDESARLRVPRAVLANTHEQAALAIPVYTALALLLPASQLSFPLLLSASFVIGRALFALGYRHGAAARAFGFTLTFYPTMAGLVVMTLRVLHALRG